MGRNTSDLIESYLKNILENSEIIEIRRAEMAQLFNCVPSQINYVINTRFTFQRGYLVESKRGGGGYIRISKVKISDQHYFLEQLMESFGTEISEANAFGIIQKLFEEKIITERGIYCFFVLDRWPGYCAYWKLYVFSNKRGSFCDDAKHVYRVGF